MNHQSDFTIREAGYPDIPAMTELLMALFSLEKDFTPDREKHMEGLKLAIDSPAYTVLVIHSARENIRPDILGMCTLHSLISTAKGQEVGLIEDVVIHPDHRGNGLGKQLLEKMQELARERHYARLQLLADKDNTPAHRFYEKMGFSHTNLIAMNMHLS